jgi:membrane fusion protein, type I secretion system
MFSRRHKGIKGASWHAGVRMSLLWPGLCALLIAGGGVGGFLVWAATAPIAGAAIASGHIAASGENQTVQHLEGGIVKTLHVKDGDVVMAGQPLISLDPTLAEATLNRARKTLLTLRADEVRLLAEQRDLDAIVFPPELHADDLDASVRDFMETKLVEFQHRLQKSRNEVRILEQRLAGLEEEVAGYEAQRLATQKQAAFIRDELRDIDYLFQKGLSRADRLFQLRRAEAELDGRDGALLSSIGKAKQSIAEIREQIERIGHERRSEAGTRLSEVRTRIADTLEQIVASENILSRIVIRAPVDGTVVRLVANTVGGVIPPGQTIVEILPRGVELVVDARLQPTDIDAVQVGRAANVRLSALNQRTTPVVAARVAYVSADRLTDRGNQQVYYRVRLQLSSEQLNAHERATLAPGMPAEAFIQTAERTMLQYLLRPIEDSLARALRGD